MIDSYLFITLTAGMESLQCVLSPLDVNKSCTPDIYIQLHAKWADKQSLIVVQLIEPNFAGESLSSSLLTDSGNSLRLDYSRTECWLNCLL